MTREEAIAIISKYDALDCGVCHQGGDEILEAFDMAIQALSQEPCEDAISRQAVLDLVNSDWKYEGLETDVASLPSVTPKPKTGYISIDDVMSVFDDFMCGEVDEEGTNTFLEMLKYKAERSE